MITEIEAITASEANLLVADYEGVVFVNKVYGMIRKAARKGGSMIFLYQEECSFLEKNVEFLNRLIKDGFEVDKNRIKTTISW